MAREIERKFLVTDLAAVEAAPAVAIRQGYLSTVPERTVRVRRSGTRGFITVKGLAAGATRAEFEYEIPDDDADEMLDTLALRPLIEKTRRRIPVGDLVWEVDVFEGENAGLVVAEVELPAEDQPLELPDWVGAEVTTDQRYTNASLVERPYRLWGRPAR